MNGTGLDHGDDGQSSATPTTPTSSSGASNDAGTRTTPPPASTPTAPRSTVPPPAAPPDSDNDGFPDSIDCAPNDPTIAGALLLNDPLATDNGFFAVATGFPTGDWSYGNAYTQSRLANLPDLTLFDKDAAITDAIVEVTAASTEVAANISPALRQVFMVFQMQNDNGNVSGIACGVEFDASVNPPAQTSIVGLRGSASKVTSTPLSRVARGSAAAGELFQLKGTLKSGVLTCEATIDGTTTTAQANVGSVAGAVGFFTNQSKALYKTANICKLK